MTDTPRKPLYVVHIRSFGHSGSTLLNILLDRCDPLFAGAELFRYERLWSRIDSQLTADGLPVRDSTFWTSVKASLRSRGQENPIIEKGEQIDADNVIAFLQAIIDTSDARVICDTSKSSRYGNILYERCDGVFVVHLVRDGRAIMNSLQCRGIQRIRMPLLWVFSNLRSWFRFRQADNCLRLRYEDLVFEPDGTIDRILDGASRTFDMPLPRDGQQPTACHAFAGNRMRSDFDGTVRYDDRYITNLSGPYWWLLTLLMLPVLVAFGYPLTKTGLKTRAQTLTDIAK